MANQWLFKSETYDNCNCAVNCGCQFNLPSTHGYCQSAFVGNIVEGHFNDTPLAGLNWAAQNAKSARRRMVTIQPNLRSWLLPVRKHSGNVTPDDLRKQFEQAREAAGIKEWPNNALRHSFASYHLARFKDAAALALQMGHTNSGMIFEHYRQLVKPREAERYWDIRPARESKVVQMPMTKGARR